MAHALIYLDRTQLATVRRRSDLRGLLYVAHAWGVIFAAMALFALWPSVVTYFAAIAAIGSRQLGLSVLMHDGAHGILLKTRWLNRVATQFLCAAPLYFNAWSYRDYHLAHHANTQQDNDPDIGLSAPFPVTKISFARKVFRDIAGLTGVTFRLGQLRAALGGKELPARQRAIRVFDEYWPSVTFNAAFFIVLAAIGQAHLYVVLWLIPLLTWFQLVLRIRNIAEHACTPDKNDPLRNTRTTHAGPIASFFLAPYNVNYHIEHHLMMYVPCYNLRRTHELLMRNGWREKMELCGSYFEVLKVATSKR